MVIIREDRLNALNELGKTRMRQNRERTQRELRAQSHMVKRGLCQGDKKLEVIDSSRSLVISLLLCGQC